MSISRGEELVGEAFRQAYEKAAGEIGQFNLAIFGKTGVGKSTLVNAIFGANLAETGIGEPVTQDEHLYRTEAGSLGILDTRGLEIGTDTEKIIDSLREYVSSMRRRPITEQVHLAWYCVRAGDSRFEQPEAEFVRALAGLGIPVLLVVTQAERRNGELHPDTSELIDHIESLDLPIGDSRAYPVMALADDWRGLAEHGLQELLDATFRAAPDAVSSAINAAQVIDEERKRKEIREVIGVATAAAGAAGASPIPFSDAVILVPIQMAMLARIAHIRGVAMDEALTASLAITVASTAAGKSLVTSLIKFIPGGGTIVGGTISATVASTLTGAMGHAWDLVCHKLFAGDSAFAAGVAKSDAIRSMFLEEFKRQATRSKSKK